MQAVPYPLLLAKQDEFAPPISDALKLTPKLAHPFFTSRGREVETSKRVQP